MMARRVWGWIVALCVFTEILLFTTAQSENRRVSLISEGLEGPDCKCETFPCSIQRRYVYADFSRKCKLEGLDFVNVALGKPASASSLMNKRLYSQVSGPACLAVNGKTGVNKLRYLSLHPTNPACVITDNDDLLSHWKVDLQKRYLLAGIKITWDQVTNKTAVGVFLDDKLIYRYSGNKSDKDYFTVPHNTTAQVIKVQRLETVNFTGAENKWTINTLVICQVEVFACRWGFYGPECENVCEKPICWNSQVCSGVDGSCPPEVKAEPPPIVECSTTSVILACVFDAVVVILSAVAAKVIPRGGEKPKEVIPKPAEKAGDQKKIKGGDQKKIQKKIKEEEDEEEEESEVTEEDADPDIEPSEEEKEEKE